MLFEQADSSSRRTGFTTNNRYVLTSISGLARNRIDTLTTSLQGCLHANMDLLKWCVNLFPLLPSRLVLRALRVAVSARTVDMCASPYDVAQWFRDQDIHDVRAIAIETDEGRAEYARQQRLIAKTANSLRTDMIEYMRHVYF